ncbi:MAG TPA: iron donor protein CyaY [Burkholderiaceae bacterium]|nr:iron donor protein CyaY [Burkholderiaceae bacterium]
MTDLEYLDRAEAALRAIEVACDRLNESTDADIDNQRTGGLLNLMLGSGGQLVVNLQKPLHEIWLAAKRGGFHFRWNGEQWVDTKTGDELFSLLSACASEQAGIPLNFGSADSC